MVLEKNDCDYIKFLNDFRAHCVVDAPLRSQNVNIANISQQEYELQINAHKFNEEDTIPVKVKEVFIHPRYVERLKMYYFLHRLYI